MSAFNKAWRLLKEKQNIHWMSPRNTGDSETPLGWINGHGPYRDLHELLADDPDGFYQTVSGHEEKGPLPWKNHEIVDGEVQEKDRSGEVPGLPGMFFDAQGNLMTKQFRTSVLCQKCQGPADDGNMVDQKWLCKPCQGLKMTQGGWRPAEDVSGGF